MLIEPIAARVPIGSITIHTSGRCRLPGESVAHGSSRFLSPYSIRAFPLLDGRRSSPSAQFGQMVKDFHIEKFGDEFRPVRSFPQVRFLFTRAPHNVSQLPNLCGWDAKLADVVPRLQRSVCGKRKCTAEGRADGRAARI